MHFFKKYNSNNSRKDEFILKNSPKQRVRKLLVCIITASLISSAAYTTFMYSDKSATKAYALSDESSYIFHSTFENDTDNWIARGSAMISCNNNTSFSGMGSLYVTGRTEAWNGAAIALSSSDFIQGKSYSFSADVLYTEGGASQNFFMKLQYIDSSGTTQYASIAEASALKGSWVQLKNTDYTIPSDASDMMLYIETAENTIDFYVDEVYGAASGTIIDGPTEKKLIYGDINCDGAIDSLDIAAGRSGLISGNFMDSISALAADVDLSGTADESDLKQIQDFVLGRITEFEKTKVNKWDTYQETASPNMLKFYSDSIYQLGNTTRIRQKIDMAQNGEKVSVAYLGGSITEGNGLDTCYAKRSCNYFSETFSTNKNVSYINAGLSGTSSVVGLMRAQNDILSKNPDIIFLEFSVNDHPEEIYKKSFESLVRQCLSQENNPAVIILITRSKGGYSSQTQMASVGKHYDVPIISMDNALTNAFNSGTLTTADYYTDEYHPHADGNALISDCIGYFYRRVMKTENITADYTIPSTSVYGSEYSTASIVPLTELSDLKNGSFTQNATSNRFPYGWVFNSNSGNNPMTFSTQGKGIFIVFKSNQNSSLGNLQVTVNGKTSTINGNRNYAWGGADADIAYIQDNSGLLDVSMKLQDGSKDFVIWGIGVIK